MQDAKPEKGQVAKIYRRIAPYYDLWAWLTESKARDRCLELAGSDDVRTCWILPMTVSTCSSTTTCLIYYRSRTS